jgi:Domain of unknown function (DUF6457)
MCDDRAVDPWLSKMRDALAATVGIEPAQLELTDDDAHTLLDLARIAAHVSGERTNAPLLCYLVGRAQRNSTVDDLAAAVRQSKS